MKVHFSKSLVAGNTGITVYYSHGKGEKYVKNS